MTTDRAANPRAVAQPPTGRRRSAIRVNAQVDRWTATAFLTPALLAFTIFVIVPAIAGLTLSFFSWDLFSSPQFVGLQNIDRLFGDAQMWQSLEVTLAFVLMGVIPTMLVGFVLAVLINVKLPGVPAFRVLYFSPIIASSAVTALIWAIIYSPQVGLFNQVLKVVGIPGPNWLSDDFWARPAIVIIMIWSALPLVLMLYLSGLQRIPEDLYAAASLDGAGAWRQLWSITWPNVWPTTLLVAVLESIGFINGSFEIPLIMTDGGPLQATESLALYAYHVAFRDRDIGYASALSLFQLLLIAVIVLAIAMFRKIRKAKS